MPKQSKYWAIATKACQDKGYKSFKEGTEGDECRKHLAEKVAEKAKKKR